MVNTAAKSFLVQLCYYMTRECSSTFSRINRQTSIPTEKSSASNLLKSCAAESVKENTIERKLYFPGGKVLTWQGDVVLQTPSETDTSNTCAERGRARSGYYILKKFKAFLASSERVVRRSRMTVTGRGGTETDTGREQYCLYQSPREFEELHLPVR